MPFTFTIHLLEPADVALLNAMCAMYGGASATSTRTVARLGVREDVLRFDIAVTRRRRRYREYQAFTPA